MPTYVTLVKYTQKGVESITRTPDRLDAAREAARAVGGEIKAFYLVMGHYDAVVVLEAPDDASVALTMLATGMQGNVRTETLRAFTEDEFRRIVAALP